MNWESVLPLAAVVVAFIVALGGFFAWVNNYVDKRHEEHVKNVADMVTGINKRLDDHGVEFGRVNGRIETNEDRMRKTREELHENFVRHTHIDQLRQEVRQDNGEIFKRLQTMSESLNQLVGLVQAKFGGDR